MRSKLATGAFAALGLFTLVSGAAAAKVTIAVGGAGCLCYLPTVLAEQLGEYKKEGLEIELVNFKGGSQALTAVIGGSADVVSGYYDHCVNLAAKNQQLTAFVVYDRYPGLVLGVSPRHTSEISSVKDLAGKKVDPDAVAVIGIGLDATAVAAMERGTVDAAVMLDPAVTLLEGKFPAFKILTDVRTQDDTLSVFGGEYPGGALYARGDWIAKHEKETQALTNAILATLKWIHSHTAEEIMAKMPDELVGADKALYLAALKNSIPMYSTTGRMDPKGAQAVLAVFSQSSPDVAKAKIDLSKTYTNRFVEQSTQKMGMQ
jgi:NitT/TauT family transport system substrate-binding protein